jgi:mono/diheme cytochrome c family protein
MSLRGFDDRRIFRLLCLVLAVLMATAPSASVVAQTNAAQQAVRRSVDNLGRSPVDTERSAGDVTAQPVSYQRDVLPILRASCHGCHGPRRTSGGLEMTTFDNLLRGGESGSPAIVPGNPDDSYLVQQITPEGGRAAMPQRRPPLRGAQIALIRRWIEEGAVNDAAASTAADSRRDAYRDERGMSSYETASGMIDTTYVAPNAIALIVLRPAQILAAPIAELLPKEVAAAAGMQYAGVDPTGIEEVVLFIQLPPTHSGGTIKFTSPFRAASIPPHLRPQAQIADLGGKRYLKSTHPVLPSFFGANNRTLVVAQDPMLRQLVESRDQPKTGTLLDRVLAAPAGSDLYLAVDIATLRPFIELGMGQAKSTGQIPPQAEKFLDIPKLVSAVELTFNMSGPRPSSLVLHANDDAAAQQLETLFTEAANLGQGRYGSEQPQSYDPVSQAMAQYKERMGQPFRPQRVGTSITLFHIDGQNPAHQQLVNLAVAGLAVAAAMPAIQAARDAAERAAQPEVIPEQPAESQEIPPSQDFQTR